MKIRYLHRGPWLFSLLTTLLTLRAAAVGTPSFDITLGQSYDASRADLALIVRVQRAYFDQINASGGVRGRNVRLISLDDHGDAAAAKNNLHELVVRFHALALFGMPTIATDDASPIPQLFVLDRFDARLTDKPGAEVVAFLPTFALEGGIIAKHLLAIRPQPKVAVLYDSEKSDERMLGGLRGVFGPRASDALTVRTTDAASLASTLQQLRDSGVTVLVVLAAPPLTVQALADSRRMGWTPERIINSTSARALAAEPAAERTPAVGVESIRYFKDPFDPDWSGLTLFRFAEFPRWARDPGVWAFNTFGKRYLPGVDVKNELIEYGYSSAQLMGDVLAQCGDEITSENIGKQSLRLAGVDVPLLTPGVRVYTYPGRTTPITQGQFIRFDGAAWTAAGEVLDADDN